MDVLMPQLGETVAEGKITSWFKTVGDPVRPGDNLFEIETDKVTMEVPAITAGVLAEIRVSAGDVARVGAIVAVITDKAGALTGRAAAETGPPPKAPQAPKPATAAPSSPSPAPATAERAALPSPAQARPAMLDPFNEVRSPARNYGPARLVGGATVTPLARRLAVEGGIDLARVAGSGPHGRIVARDIGQARTAPTPTPAQAASPIMIMADVVIGQPLALCADVPEIALTDIVVKAWAVALARVMPGGNSDVALVTRNGRTVIRDAGGKSLSTISSMRGEAGTASASETASSAISIPGVPSITSLVDNLRPPQTTLLSVGAPRRAPIEAPGGSVQFADVMTVTLSCDHRVVDGVLGADLLAAFKGFVERPVTMLV